MFETWYIHHYCIYFESMAPFLSSKSKCSSDLFLNPTSVRSSCKISTIKACGYFVVENGGLLACSIFIIPLKFTETTLREKKRWVRVKRSEVAKVHYLCQRRQVKPFMLLIQYIQLLGCFHFFKTAAVCSLVIQKLHCECINFLKES